MNIEPLIDNHKGKPAIVIAHGPSLNDHIEEIENKQKSGHIVIECNEWHLFHSFQPDYWLFANTQLTMSSQIHVLNQYRIPILYADTVDLTDRKWIENNLKCEYLGYDQRHFDNKPCYAKKCCHQLVPGRKTIQEELQHYCKFDQHYGAGDTCAIHMISFMVLFGCNPIYFVGIDLDYSLGYAKHNGNIRLPNAKSQSQFRERILKDLKIIVDSAKNVGVDVINLNKNSTFDVAPIGELR